MWSNAFFKHLLEPRWASDGFVDESLLWGYRLSFVDLCGADLGEIAKARHSEVSSTPKTRPKKWRNLRNPKTWNGRGLEDEGNKVEQGSEKAKRKGFLSAKREDSCNNRFATETLDITLGQSRILGSPALAPRFLPQSWCRMIFGFVKDVKPAGSFVFKCADCALGIRCFYGCLLKSRFASATILLRYAAILNGTVAWQEPQEGLSQAVKSNKIPREHSKHGTEIAGGSERYNKGMFFPAASGGMEVKKKESRPLWACAFSDFFIPEVEAFIPLSVSSTEVNIVTD